MWRRVVLLLPLLSLLSLPVSAGTVSQGNTSKLYLPMMKTGSSPLVEFVETSHLGCENGGCRVFGSSTWVYGYVKTTSATPVYGVSLGVDVTESPFCPPEGPCQGSATKTVTANPAFSVTLPGQVNPFGYTGIVAQVTTDVHRVAWVAGRPRAQGEAIAQALTIVNWNKEGSRVSGTVRNDTISPLKQLRVVVADLSACSWKDTTLDIPSLAPGATADFQLEYTCGGPDLVAVGQGVMDQ